MTDLDLFDYELPEELIAATPAERRDQSRLLVLDRRTGALEHRRFLDLPELLTAGDLLVMNDARVIPARLRARRTSGGAVELLLVRPRRPDVPHVWLAIVNGRGRLKEGEVLSLEGTEAHLALLERNGDGTWTVSLGIGNEPAGAVQGAGAMPQPPYLRRVRRRRGLPEDMPELDRERYQTVYARRPGAVAAPTAGLHITDRLLECLRARGVRTAMLSLLVGPGTFQPVRAARIEDHRLDAEYFDLPGGTAQAVASALDEGRRIVAVGTTTCRVLEHVARSGGWREQEGWTDLFIYPPFEFRAVGALITNFHLPRSTLLMLVAAFAGRQNVLGAYREAIKEGYRFYSYGDAMLIS
jgi:S-adenosylmethionine:tRNA ribosyltransferase-isomerase